ncbi:hypothetical protein ACHQM5_014802 [Ranunculus cassubicifolius]
MASTTPILCAVILSLAFYSPFVLTGTEARQAPTISSLLSEKKFNKIFPHLSDDSCPAKGFYNYGAFINATKRFPQFGTTGSKTIHLMNSSGPYTWGLWRLEEADEDDTSAGYCDESFFHFQWNCDSFKSYKGRGPMMFRWNFNYGPVGQALGFDATWYPERLISNSTLAFESALWYWMTARNSIPSCHSVMVGNYKPTPEDMEANRISGYGLTTNYIVASSFFYPAECNRIDDGRVRNRIGYFKRITAILKVSTGSNFDCANQKLVEVTPPTP